MRQTFTENILPCCNKDLLSPQTLSPAVIWQSLIGTHIKHSDYYRYTDPENFNISIIKLNLIISKS